MTQEQENLLLKDLCARLPYGVKGRVSSRDCNNRECEFVATIGGKLYDRFAVAQELWFDNVIIKPYLFPMSSMTKEQEKEYDKAYMKDMEAVRNNLLKFAKGEPILDGAIMYHHIEWLNKNKFDYRGLIPMGLANDATGLNIY